MFLFLDILFEGNRALKFFLVKNKSAKMSEFKSLLAIENINDVFVRREAAKVEVTNTVNKLKSLDTSNPNLRQFTVLDKELESNLKGLRDDNHVFILSLLHESPAITQDSEFGKDQGVVWSIQFEALKEKDTISSY